MDKERSTVIEKVKTVTLLACCPAILTLGLTVANYYSISNKDSYNMLIEFSKSTDEANVTTITGLGVTAQILNLDKVDDSNQDVTESENTDKDTSITQEVIYNSLAGDVSTWNGRISPDDFKKYKDDFIHVNGNIINSVTNNENGTVTYTFENGMGIVSDINIDVDKARFFSHDVPDNLDGITEEIDETTTKTTYDNGVVKIVYTVVDGADIPVGDDLMDKPIKLNYKLDFKSMLIFYIGAGLIEIAGYVINKIRLRHNRNKAL